MHLIPFQLRLAYTFLDGQTESNEGWNDFSNDQNTEENKLLEDIVGDWSVEYSLTRDGRFREQKYLESTNQRVGNQTGDQNFETGVSLRFVHSFNEFKNLLTSSRKEAIRAREEKQRNSGGSATDNVDSSY